MPRPRKTTKFAKFLDDLDIEDLKTLKSEVGIQMRARERAAHFSKRKNAALKLRDRLKIGQRVTYKQPGNVSGKAEIVAIFVDRVQIISDGKKKYVPLIKIDSTQ